MLLEFTSVSGKSDPVMPGGVCRLEGIGLRCLGSFHLYALRSTATFVFVHRPRGTGIACEREDWWGYHRALLLQRSEGRRRHVNVLGPRQLPQFKMFSDHYLDGWVEGDGAVRQQVYVEREPDNRQRVPHDHERQGSRQWDILLPCGDPRMVQWSAKQSRGCDRERWVQRCSPVSVLLW